MTDTTVHGSLNRTLAILLVLAVSGALIASFLGTYLAGIVVVLIFAYAKACFVILDFMEMRGTRGALRPALLTWPAILLTLALARSVAVSLLG